MDVKDPVESLDSKIESLLKCHQNDSIEWLLFCVNMEKQRATFYGSDIGKSFLHVRRNTDFVESFHCYCKDLYSEKSIVEQYGNENSAVKISTNQQVNENVLAEQMSTLTENLLADQMSTLTENVLADQMSTKHQQLSENVLAEQMSTLNENVLADHMSTKQQPQTKNILGEHLPTNQQQVNENVLGKQMSSKQQQQTGIVLAEQMSTKQQLTENIQEQISAEQQELVLAEHQNIRNTDHDKELEANREMEMNISSNELKSDILKKQDMTSLTKNKDVPVDNKENHKAILSLQNVLANENHTSENDEGEVHILPDGSAWKQVYFICQIKQEVVSEGDDSTIPVKNSRQEVEITHILDRGQFSKKHIKIEENIKAESETLEQPVGQNTTENGVSVDAELQNDLDSVSLSSDKSMDEDDFQLDGFDESLESVLQEVRKQDSRKVVENFVKILDQFDPEIEDDEKVEGKISSVEESEFISSENAKISDLPLNTLETKQRVKKKLYKSEKENVVKCFDNADDCINHDQDGDLGISKDFKVKEDLKYSVPVMKSCFVLLEDLKNSEICSKEKCVFKHAFYGNKHKSLGKAVQRVITCKVEPDVESKLGLSSTSSGFQSDQTGIFHKCTFCRKKFLTKKGLKQHGRNHVGDVKDEPLHRCQICEKEFKTKKGIVYHMQYVNCYLQETGSSSKITEQSRYKCKIGSTVYSKKEHLHKHQFHVHRHGNTVKAKLSNKNTSVENPVLVSGFRKYKCQICRKPYHNFGLLKIHLKRMHSSLLSKKWQNYLNSDSKADIKRTLLSSKTKKLQGHIKGNPLENAALTLRYKCQVCSRKFSKFLQLQVHIKKIHSGSKFQSYLAKKGQVACKETGQGQGQQDLYKCHSCSKVYHSRSGLFKHKSKMCNHGDMLKCCHCGKRFPSELHLKYHSSIHNKGNIAKMSKKIRVMSSKRLDVGHVEKGKKSHQCTVCKKRFLFTNILQRHMLIFHTHVSEKRCKICSKEFKNLKTLTGHMFVHMERTLSCQVCNRKFSDPKRLREHMKTYHPGIQ